MSHVMASSGFITARHGGFHAPGLPRQRRTAHLQIRMKGNNNLLTVEQTSKAIETQLRRAQGGSGDSRKDAFSAQSQPEQ